MSCTKWYGSRSISYEKFNFKRTLFCTFQICKVSYSKWSTFLLQTPQTTKISSKPLWFWISYMFYVFDKHKSYKKRWTNVRIIKNQEKYTIFLLPSYLFMNTASSIYVLNPGLISKIQQKKNVHSPISHAWNHSLLLLLFKEYHIQADSSLCR